MSTPGILARRAKPLAVVVLIAAGGLVLLASTQTWLTAAVASGPIEVAGTDAAPLVRPLALAVLALALVLTLVGRALRYVLGALAALAGAGLAWAIAPAAFAPPISAVAAVVTERTGLAGEEAVSGLVESITATGWPLAALAAAVVAMLGGVFVIATAHAWRRGGRRFEQAVPRGEHGTVDPIDSWDELSHGEDPTR